MARSPPKDIDTMLALRAKGRLLIGRERIALLEAVIEHKSITKAAAAAGFSYKTAWDAVNAINNLLPRPAFITRTGGSHGGGAEITDEGRRLIRTFRRIEEKLGRISTAISEEGLENEEDALFLGLSLTLSARNVFYCTVIKISPGEVNVEVKLEVTSGFVITAGVTNASVQELGLALGRPCVAIVNASSILIAQDGTVENLSARNKVRGIVTRRTDDSTACEVAIDIGGGKTITAVISRQGADDAGAEIGTPVLAIFKTSHVILAAD